MRALLAEWVFEKKVPAGVGFLRALGTALAVVLLAQAATGMLLAFCYSPSPDHAYDSIRYIDHEVTGGRLLRGLHHWGSSAVIVLAFLHLARVYFTGAYKKPRALLWVLGVAIFGVLLGFGFTGYLLPWDLKGFWATDVGINIVATVPGVGAKLADLLRGGPEVGAPTLTRLFAMHVLALPALLLPLAGLHLLLVHQLGITPPGARVGEPEVKSEPFFPDHVLRELLVAALALIVVFALAWKLGAPLEAPADRDAQSYEPRPEWYFLGMFQLLKLKLFRGSAVVLATVGIPGVLALLALLLPWLDRNPERAPAKRPIAMAAGLVVIAAIGGLTWSGAQDAPTNHRPPPPYVPAGDGSYVPPSSPPFPPPEKRDDATKPAPTRGADATLLAAGEKLVATYECLKCHTLHGVGNETGEGAPELAGAAKGHDRAWLEQLLLNPRAVKPDSDMPSAKVLEMSDEDRKTLAEWLRAIAGD